MAGGPSRPGHSCYLLLPAKGPPLSCSRRTPTEPTVSEPPPRLPLVCTLPLALHRAVLIAACRRPAFKGGLCADLERCHLPERQRISGAADVFPEACSRGARGPARAKGRRRREHGGTTPSHTGLVGEDSLLCGRVGTVNPASPAGESGLGKRAVSGGVGVLTRRKRGSPGLTPWEGHAGRGRVGGTPELRIVEGADDNLAPFPLFTWGAENARNRPPPIFSSS